jgi:hypothetical protein
VRYLPGNSSSPLSNPDELWYEYVRLPHVARALESVSLSPTGRSALRSHPHWPQRAGVRRAARIRARTMSCCNNESPAENPLNLDLCSQRLKRYKPRRRRRIP